MRLESGRIAVAVAALLVGMMVAIQFRLQQVVPPPTATDQLLSLLKTSDQQRAALTQEVAQLKAQLRQKLSQSAADRQIAQELTRDEILAGTIPVKGPGIEVIWSNGTAPAGYQLTDIDLLLLVNELRASGAEAIAINGQRITAETEIRAAGNYVLINNSQEDPPFTIDAIGNPQTLTDGLKLPGGLYDQSLQEGRSMIIRTVSQLTVPAAPPLADQYASPAVKP
ncbi:MAG: DUF881 domain-containing protein [Firmicutes bacterium]|nr:DUF881 domain-containing protein [Alicyclobacillaceae bacterium]MCL6497581.1 DUF881 domain-containing protein [Bacillota bacterium]